MIWYICLNLNKYFLGFILEKNYVEQRLIPDENDVQTTEAETEKSRKLLSQREHLKKAI